MPDAADARQRAVTMFDVERDVVEAWTEGSHLAAVLDLLERHASALRSAPTPPYGSHHNLLTIMVACP